MQQSKPGAKATQQAVENSFRSRNTKVRSAAVPPPNECPTIDLYMCVTTCLVLFDRHAGLRRVAE